MYTASPVYIDGVIYGMSNKRRGQSCDSRPRWLVEVVDAGARRHHASILQANDHCCSSPTAEC